MCTWECVLMGVCVFCVYACEHVCAYDRVCCVLCVYAWMWIVSACMWACVFCVHAYEHVCCAFCVCMHVSVCACMCVSKIFSHLLILLHFSFLFHRQIDFYIPGFWLVRFQLSLMSQLFTYIPIVSLEFPRVPDIPLQTFFPLSFPFMVPPSHCFLFLLIALVWVFLGILIQISAHSR